MPETSDTEVDVVVVGSGAGGLAAALTARLHGLTVVVLEKAPVVGGTTAISGGGMWLPLTSVSAGKGSPDSRENVLAYFRNMTGNRFDQARAHAFVDVCAEMVDFFQARTALKFRVAEDRPDYSPSVEGASLGGRTIFPLPFNGRELGANIELLRRPAAELTFLGMMIRPGPELKQFMNVLRSTSAFRHVTARLLKHFKDVLFHGRSMNLSNGNALVARMLKTGLDSGVVFRTNANIETLLVEDGVVSGVRLVGKNGHAELRARRGVVLATGGFPQSTAWKQRLYPHAARDGVLASPAPAQNTGDGLTLARVAGARIDDTLSNPAAWAPVSLVPRRGSRKPVFPHLIDRQKPGFIAVLPNGRRFVNEANSYHDFGKALIASTAQDDEAICFLLADHRTVRRYGIGIAKPAPVPLGSYVRSGYLKRSASIRGLAQALRIQPDALERTVEAFNKHARQGTDPEFGRGSTAYNRYNGDGDHRPNPCVAPLEIGPFYGVEVRLGELGTFAGISTDANAQVLDERGQPIGGLFAVGNDMSHVMRGEYLGGGATLGPAMAFGYIAGRHLARSVAAK